MVDSTQRHRERRDAEKNLSAKQFGLICVILTIFAFCIQFYALRTNPPGFFLDESSIAYNAYKIATTGTDEHGESWPLFFRAFGEYKNPVYIYLLAGVYRLSGPGVFNTRALSAFAGLATALLLGLLAFRITTNRYAALLFGTCALLTPWLFELSRLVLEVAIYPLVVVLFLHAVWSAARKLKWDIKEICAIAFSLTLLTYTYSIGRLLAPLLAIGLIFFASRKRLPGILLTWLLFGMTLVPLLVFHHNHPSALTVRFNAVSFFKPENSWIVTGEEFAKHLLLNVDPWKLFVTESSKVNVLVHIPGPPAMLTIVIGLIVASVVLLIRNKQVDAWWSFIFYGLVVSVVPASLTVDVFHMLRLSPLPIFLLVLSIPAIHWLTSSTKNAKLVRAGWLMFFIVVQGLTFQWQYQRSVTSPQRLHTFDADYPAVILPAALSRAGSQPIYLAYDPARPVYVHAFWYGILKGIPVEKFVDLGFEKAPPENAVVITTEERCLGCQLLAKSEPYTTYVAPAPSQTLVRLPDSEMNAEVSVMAPREHLRPGQQIKIEVTVKNLSKTIWPVGDRSASPFRVALGNHWLDINGQTIVNDDGRAPLNGDLRPGEQSQIFLTINAPLRKGELILEIDLLQEGVSWFGLKGSRTWRGKVVLE